MFDQRGFSLTELIVVVVILATLLALTTLNFSDWTKKYNIEAQVKEMTTDLTEARLLAIQQKKRHIVTLNPKSYVLRRYSSEFDANGTVVQNKNLKYEIQRFTAGAYSAFANTTVTFGDLGYTTDLITIAVGVGLARPALNCLTIHNARVNMGMINGNNCEFR